MGPLLINPCPVPERVLLNDENSHATGILHQLLSATHPSQRLIPNPSREYLQLSWDHWLLLDPNILFNCSCSAIPILSMAETQQEPTLPPSTNHRPDMVAQGQEFSNDAPPRTPPDVDDLGLPMDVPEDQEEPTLPPHPASIEQDAAPYLVPNKRKRSTILQLMSDSSEMPIFSSDDDPAAENYRDGQGRQKRQYTGSWDRQQPIQDHSPQPESRVKRKFERQVDSGVFLGSDVSADSSFDGLPVRPSASRLGYPQFTQIPRSSRQWVLSPAEAEARRRILHCLETANETIDLS